MYLLKTAWYLSAFKMIFSILPILISFLYGENFKINIPKISGIEVVVGKSIAISKGKTALVFQFKDGRIVVGKKDKSMWSYDGGHTWKKGSEGPGEKVAIDLGSGEILSISRNSHLREDGLYTLNQKRSTDNWKTAGKA